MSAPEEAVQRLMRQAYEVADPPLHFKHWLLEKGPAALESALREALQPQWLPIETAPKDGTNVLLINRRGNIASGLWQKYGDSAGWWLRGGDKPNVFYNDHHGPTHWMPWPLAPGVARCRQHGANQYGELRWDTPRNSPAASTCPAHSRSLKRARCWR